MIPYQGAKKVSLELNLISAEKKFEEQDWP